MKTKEITLLQKGLNNCSLIKSHLKNSAIFDARGLVEKSSKPVVFGGKFLFRQRCLKKIDKETFLIKRLRPLCSIGESSQKANRLFRIQDDKTILFSIDRDNRFILSLQSIGKKREKYLELLKQLQDSKQIPVTYKLDLNYIYLTFDYNILQEVKYKTKENRVFAVDLNPNSVGWSVADWKNEKEYKVIQAGTLSLKPLNDYQKTLKISSDSKKHKYITNKRKHEIIEMAKKLFSLCKHYRCEIFSVEDLNIKRTDSKKGKRFNRLVNNQWDRNLLAQQIRKHVNSSSTLLTEVQPQYSSYLGNLLYRKEGLPDECLSSLEIGRRGYEFASQFIFKRRSAKKTVVFPLLEAVKNQLALSLEELGIDVPAYGKWKDILSWVKKSGKKYRFSFSEAIRQHSEKLFSKFYKQKYLLVYEYL